MKEKEKCSGCMGCEQICPKSAIDIIEGKKGFLSPKISEEKCINCKLCEKVCLINQYSEQEQQQIYAVKNKDTKIREDSTSGGMFTLLAKYILEQNGKVYGTTLTNNMDVIMTRITKENDIEKLRGTKYVQSKICNTYNEIYSDLENGNKILFTGTPCQCNALRKFLKIKGISLENIYICDLICHGVPSPRVWKEYVKFIEKKYKSKIEKYNFRYKKIAWRGHNVYIKFKNGKEIINSNAALSYANLYSKDLMIRESCYSCQFASMNRCGDLTIGDCWGIEKVNKEFDDNKGVSLAILNNEKGKEMFNAIKNSIDYIMIDKEQCMQRNLRKPTDKPKNVEQFWSDFNQKGYEYVAKKYSKYGIKNRIKVNLKKIIKDVIKRARKK